MALDLRTQLNGFSIETLRGHLAKIENDSAYSYYADVIRAFLSSDAKEVAKGYDCGMQVKNYNDIKEGDVIESFHEVAVKKKLK